LAAKKEGIIECVETRIIKQYMLTNTRESDRLKLYQLFAYFDVVMLGI